MKLSNFLFLLAILIVNDIFKDKNSCFCDELILNSSNNNQTNNDVKNEDNNPKYSYIVKNILCDDYVCPMTNGICIDFTTCSCNKGFVNRNVNNNTFSKEINNDSDISDNKAFHFCNYKMKSSITAFILELIIPLGIGHFYSGNYLKAVFKFLLTICICLLCSLTIVNKDNFNLKLLFTIMILVSTFGFFAWHIYDLYCYITNKYTDSNDFPMY